MTFAWHHGGRGVSLALLGGVLLLAGCAEFPGGPAANTVEAPAPITDPVIAFAAASGPGAVETVTLPSTGQVVQLRLVRAYMAASGRECREVQLGSGGGSSTRLVCGAGTGWREARPLLRNASAAP